MPYITDANGVARYVPGVYHDENVISNLPGAIPAFQIPVVVGAADHARYPRTYNADKYSEESEHPIMVEARTSSKARADYGDDSNIAVAMAWAKKHGLPLAYCLAVNALTRASVIATSTGPVVQGTIYSKVFGAVGGHIKLRVASGTTVTITPVKRYSLLTANASTGASRVYVKDATWIKAGDKVTIGDNDTADAIYTVASVGTELDTAGQVAHFITLTSTLSADITTAQYGMVLVYDDGAAESPAAFSSVQLMLDWMNTTSKYLGFHKATATFSNPAALLAVASATPLKEISAWSTVVKGTSPADSSSDYTSVISSLESTEWDRFALTEGLLPQAFLVLSSSSTVHGAFRDWAIDKRAEGQPISVTTGGAWADTATGASDDTNPKVRAQNLNSQDVSIWSPGLDRLAPFLSLAPAVFGRRIGGGVGHNLTYDDILYTSIEKLWDERGSGELSALLRGGVGTLKLVTSGAVRFRIAQGLSTLQNNANAWNESTSDTPLLMQRDLADFVARVIMEDLDGSQIGADEVTPDTVAAVVRRRADKTLIRRGYVTSFTINSVTLNASGTGYDVDWSVRLPVTNDYLRVTTNILIGE